MIGWVSDGAKPICPAPAVTLKKYVKHFIIVLFACFFLIRVLNVQAPLFFYKS